MFTPIQKIKKLHDKHHDEDLGHCIYEDLVYDLHVVQAEVQVDEGFLVGQGGDLVNVCVWVAFWIHLQALETASNKLDPILSRWRVQVQLFSLHMFFFSVAWYFFLEPDIKMVFESDPILFKFSVNDEIRMFWVEEPLMTVYVNIKILFSLFFVSFYFSKQYLLS